MLKKVSWGSALESIVLIAVGVLTIIFPDVTSNVAAMILGIGGIAFGAVNILSYFFMDIEESMHSNQFVVGLICVLAGIVILVKQDLIIDLIPVILGIVVMVSGFTKLQRGIVARRIGYDGASVYLVLALISIVFGIIVMFFLTGENMKKILFILIGIALVYSGASDLFANFFLASKYNSFVKAFQTKIKEEQGDVIDAETKEEEVKKGE